MIRPIGQDSIREAAVAVREGNVIAFPTDTVYGLGCDPFNRDAVRRLVRIKKRGDAPLPVLVASLARAREMGDFAENAVKLAEAFWPGALTLVVPALSDLPTEITGLDETVGLRIPDRDDVLELIRLSNGALVGTSANISGRPSGLTAQEVETELGKEVDLILDGGPSGSGTESTVVSVNAEGVKVLRESAITRERIFGALGKD